MSYREIKIKEVRCRGTHLCIWCGGIIKPKDMATVNTYEFEGKIRSDHWHPECFAAQLDVDIDSDFGFEPYIFVRGKPWTKADVWEFKKKDQGEK